MNLRELNEVTLTLQDSIHLRLAAEGTGRSVTLSSQGCWLKSGSVAARALEGRRDLFKWSFEAPEAA